MAKEADVRIMKRLNRSIYRVLVNIVTTNAVTWMLIRLSYAYKYAGLLT